MNGWVPVTEALGSSDDFFGVSATDPVLVHTWRYWDGLRRGRRCPSRADIDPVDIPALLPHIGLIDVEDDATHFRFRLLGTRINEMFGANLTGMYLDLYPGRPYAVYLVDLYGEVARQRRTAFLESVSRYAGGRRLLSRRVIMPLAEADGIPVTMLLFATTFHPLLPVDAIPGTDPVLEPPYPNRDLIEIATSRQYWR